MNKTQKKLLARLMAVTNSLGGTLDGTATCEQNTLIGNVLTGSHTRSYMVYLAIILTIPIVKMI